MFELVFSDVRFPEGDGIFLLKWVNRKGIEIPFLIMTEYAPISDAVRAIKLGGKDYLPNCLVQTHQPCCPTDGRIGETGCCIGYECADTGS